MKKIKKILVICSVLLNIVLVTYGALKINHISGVYSNLSFGLQSDLVQLETNIDYQIKNNWREEDTVIEKVEDIRESIHYLMITGKDLGIITKAQEKDLWKLIRYFSNYPTYSGYPNTKLDDTTKNSLIELKADLRSSGWGMNLGYGGDWNSFSKKLNTLIK